MTPTRESADREFHFDRSQLACSVPELETASLQ